VAALRSCLEEVERLTTLVEELLMLARIDAGQERGPGQPVALAALVRDTIARMEAPAREHGIALSYAGAVADDVQVNHAALGLVLRNLLENALKFSPPGGRIEIGLERKEGAVLLTVAAQGPGIAAAELPYVFDRFFRGTGARASEVAGVGLGLALSQSIMRAGGGTITAANRPGGGALFTVQLQQTT